MEKKLIHILPQHEPPESVWTRLEQQLPLLALPQHEPQAQVWGNIENQLPLIALKEYEPPIDIWQSIENQLDSAAKELQSEPKNEAKIRRLGGFKFSKTIQSMAAAVAILIVASVGFLIFKNSPVLNTNMAQINITQETVDARLTPTLNADDDNAVAAIEEMCAADLPKCETPDFVHLKEELDELTDAEMTLKNAISAYNSDADLVVQLTEIENQRAAVLRKLIEMI